MVCALSDQYFHRQNLSPLVAGQLFPVVFQWVVGFIAGFMNIAPAGWLAGSTSPTAVLANAVYWLEQYSSACPLGF